MVAVLGLGRSSFRAILRSGRCANTCDLVEREETKHVRRGIALSDNESKDVFLCGILAASFADLLCDDFPEDGSGPFKPRQPPHQGTPRLSDRDEVMRGVAIDTLGRGP